MFRATAVKFMSASAVLMSAATAFADGTAPIDNAPQGGGGSSFLFIMIAMIAIIYFVMIRPEKKRQKERQEKLNALKKGDKVVTIGGLIGTIVAIKDTSYLIKTGEGAVVEFTKSAMQGPLGDTDTSTNAAAPTVDAEEKK